MYPTLSLSSGSYTKQCIHLLALSALGKEARLVWCGIFTIPDLSHSRGDQSSFLTFSREWLLELTPSVMAAPHWLPPPLPCVSSPSSPLSSLNPLFTIRVECSCLESFWGLSRFLFHTHTQPCRFWIFSNIIHLYWFVCVYLIVRKAALHSELGCPFYVFGEFPTYEPSSCELSKMWTCIRMSNHISWFTCLVYIVTCVHPLQVVVLLCTVLYSIFISSPGCPEASIKATVI